jgi:hypothetical protein
LTVQDDGAGLQVGRVQTKAVALGLLQPDETVDARRAAELILHPGLSTAAQITELSGRGIGMDAVQASVQQLGGQLRIDSQPGQGCTFTITLPAPPQVEQVVACGRQLEHCPASPQHRSRAPHPRRTDGRGGRPGHAARRCDRPHAPVLGRCRVAAIRPQQCPVGGRPVHCPGGAQRHLALGTAGG